MPLRAAHPNPRQKQAWRRSPIVLLVFGASLTGALLLHYCRSSFKDRQESQWTALDNVELVACSIVFLVGCAILLRLVARRQADLAVRRSEERLRISQRIAHIGSWDWDLASGRLDCSEELCRILGIEEGGVPANYQELLALLPDDARALVASAVGDALAGAPYRPIEHKVVRPDGSERLVYAVGDVFRDGAGKALRVVSVVHDITERKEAEGAVSFEKRYRAVIENLPQRIFLKDKNSVYLSCNSSFARKLGLQPADVFGKTDFDLYPELLARSRQEDDRRVLEAGEAEESDQQREMDGCWVSKALIPLKDEDGKLYGLLGILTDIDLRKKAEQRLKESEARFRDTFEQAAVGICHLDLEGVLIRINRRFCDILGYSQEELLGSTLDRVIHPEDQFPERSLGGRLLRREIGNYCLELRHLRKDDSVVWVNLTKYLVCGEGGEPRYIACVIEDITAKREARALRQERDLVQAASRAKSQFLAGMSHEIRTPMNAIIGLGRLALQTELSIKQREYLEQICSSSQTLLYIIDDILDFSKIEAGRVELEKTDFSLPELLSSISDLFSAKAQEKGIGYRVLLPDDLPEKLLGDPLRLTQVLNNLVANAVKFTDKGEVAVAVRSVGGAGGKVALQFCVQDTGIGLSSEQVARIFTPFTQADSSTTRRFGGTGLGLSISSKLVELMGGELRVESVSGAGSSFYFTVGFDIPPELAGDDGIEQLRALRLLVLEADTPSRERLSGLLAGLPLAPDFVATVPATLAALLDASSGKSPLDLLILDGSTVGEEGVETICRSSSELFPAGLPIVVMVPMNEVAKMQQRAVEWGISSVLPRPARASLMLDGIVRALSEGGASGHGSVAADVGEAGGGGREEDGKDTSPEVQRKTAETALPVGLEPVRVAAEAAKLERLLARNSLDAKLQFRNLQAALPPGAFGKEMKMLEGCLERLDFKKARKLLSQFPGLERTPEERKEV